jgi:hypothetical protein
MNPLTISILCLAFASCYQKPTDNNALPPTKYPNVPTMGSAEDAMNAK